jgi:ATP-binding cassette subfamily D (ALD) protein 3
MLVNLGEAMGRLVLSGRELTRLAGLTARMRDLKAVLDDLNAGVYSGHVPHKHRPRRRLVRP